MLSPYFKVKSLEQIQNKMLILLAFILILIFNLSHVSIFSKLNGNNCSLLVKSCQVMILFQLCQACNLTKSFFGRTLGKSELLKSGVLNFNLGNSHHEAVERLWVPKHKIFIKWGFVFLGRRATKQQGKKKSDLKNPPYCLLKNGLRLWHEDMLWVSQIRWEAKLLAGLKKRKSSWLHGAHAPHWASFFPLTRQGDLIGFSAAEGVLSAKGEAAGRGLA